MSKDETKTDAAWNALFDKYDIARQVSENGSFLILADQIKEYREPRLMAKFDHRKNLPEVFKSQGFGILPVSRGAYQIGPYGLFANLPDPNSSSPVYRAAMPSEVESIAPGSITSETVALNCAWDAGILQKFLGEESLYPTLSGRMGAAPFQFRISSNDGKQQSVIDVDGAQIEIDAA